MIIKLLLIVFVLLILYSKRNNIKKYFDKEMSNIKDINDIDKETNALIDHYSSFSTESLIDKTNTDDLNERELKAIKKVLNDKQPPPAIL